MAASAKEVEARNKELVLTAYQTCFGDHDIEAVDKYFSPNFIGHNPHMSANGTEAVKDALRTVWATGPKKKIDVRRVCAEGDLVWLHILFPDPLNLGKSLAIVDIFRVQDGKLAEHWDVIQPMDDLIKGSKNTHPFF